MNVLLRLFANFIVEASLESELRSRSSTRRLDASKDIGSLDARLLTFHRTVDELAQLMLNAIDGWTSAQCR